MTFVPHYRLTMSGTIGGNIEMFSCNLALQPHSSAWQSAVTGAAQLSLLTNALVDFQSTSFEDMVTDCVNFWQRPESQIHARARLTRVKLVAIDSEGRYASSPAEAARDVAGGATAVDDFCPPWQIARKVTLETDGDLNRVKGGFYLPLPPMASTNWDPSSGLSDIASTESVRDSVVTLLNDLANEPGLDDLDLRPVVASQGRHNRDGSVRVAPANWEVKRVNVGRRLDVQRRRANKRTEARLADATVSF